MNTLKRFVYFLCRCQRAFAACFLLAVVAPLSLSAQEPPHPILSIPGSSNPTSANNIVNNYTEQQYTNNFVPRVSPRNMDYGFGAAVVSGDTGWSWSSSNPNLLTSTPSGTVFPTTPSYTIKTQAVLVMSGKTLQVPYYNRAGSTTAKTFVFEMISYNKRSKLRGDLNVLAPTYMASGATHATRNQSYARRIAISLLDWANSFPDYVITAKNSASYIDAGPSYVLASDLQRASDHNGLAHEWADDEVLAFDAIYDSPALTNLSTELGFDVRAYISSNLFCNEGDFIAYHVPPDVATDSNLSGPFTVLPLVARVLNRPDYILWMDDYLTITVREKIHRDGALSEGMGYSIGYINENTSAAQNTKNYFNTRPANTQDLVDISNRVGGYVKVLQYGQNQWKNMALPNGQLPSFGDTPFNTYFSTRTNAGLSDLLPSYGTVSMGSGTGSQSVQVNQNFSGDNNHMRSDTTAYTLWAFNNEMLGNVRYHNGTPGRNFTEQILAYNAVTIDRSDMTSPSANTYGNGDLTIFEPGINGLAVTELDGQRAYNNKASRYQRILMLNTVDLNRPYLVDIFRVAGGATHDYVLHGSIRYDQTFECSFPLVTNTSTYPMLEGSEVWVEPTSSGSSFPDHGFWRNVSSNTAPGDFQITYRDTSSANRDLRLWMTDGSGLNVNIGRTPVPSRANGEPVNWWTNNIYRPSSIIRKRIPSGTLQDLFVSVVEPMNNGVATVQSVQRIPMASSMESVGLKITFTDGRVDTYIVNLRNPQVTGATGGSQTVSSVDGLYNLTGRIGAHSQGPGGTRSWTVNATDFQYAGRRFTTPNTYYSGLIVGETRKLTGGNNDAFVTTTALPTGTALRGRQISLGFGTLSGSGITTGISELFEIDQVILTNSEYHVCFTNDHQLEITNSTITYEQMGPLRHFTGSNSFEIALSGTAFSISPIADVNIAPGGSSGAIPFTFGNLGSTPGASLSVLTKSSNQALVPDGNITLGGGGTSRTVNVNTVPGQTGMAGITISITDGVWTNSLTFTALVSDFLLTGSPASQSIFTGQSTNFTATLVATNGFAGLVTFDVAGIPPNATSSFSPPTIIGSGASTLTVTTSTNTPPGSYPLTLIATSPGLSNSTTVTLNVSSIVAFAGSMVWNYSSGGNTNWSVPNNWLNTTAGGGGPPGVSNDVTFGVTGAVLTSNTVNNVVDSDTTINWLAYASTTGYHTTLIQPGRTLTLTGFAPPQTYSNNTALAVGIEQYTTANQVVAAAITGADGKLVINNTNVCIQLRQGFGSGLASSYALLDLSGLGNFSANMRRLQLGAESGAPRRVAGILYLARTNTVTLGQALDVNVTNYSSGTPALYLGHNTQSGSVIGSAVYLGITNGIFVNNVVIGRGNQTNNLLAFNPAFLASNPTAYFRGSDGVSRVGQWTAGDNSAGSLTVASSGTNDFRGGTVDAMVDRMFLGRGRTGNTVTTGYGTLSFEAGTFDVNTLRLGTMIDEFQSTNASGVGFANVNGSGVLRVNTILELAHTNTTGFPIASAVAGTRGTLNVNGGTVQATNIVSGGGGSSVINLNSGTIDLKPDWANANGRIANVSQLNVGVGGETETALLNNAALISTTNTITVASNGVVAGNTVITSPRLVLNGTLTPGADGPGAMTNSGAVVLGAGGRFVWEINDAQGDAVTNRDFLQSASGIDVQATSGNPFIIVADTASSVLPGELANFDNNTAYNWTIMAGTTGTVSNFASSKFAVNADQFTEDLAGGYFRVTASGGSLLLSFTNNHPPNADDAGFFYSPAAVLQIPVASLAGLWSDPDGDPVQLLDVETNSANGINNVWTDGTYIYYTNAIGSADTITYTIRDVRSTAPAVYRPGDTVRTATALIQLVRNLPAMNVSTAEGNLIFRGSNGSPGADYYVLWSSNVALPLGQWTRLSTNAFDDNGVFNFTNTPNPGEPQQFFRLQLP